MQGQRKNLNTVATRRCRCRSPAARPPAAGLGVLHGLCLHRRGSGDAHRSGGLEGRIPMERDLHLVPWRPEPGWW